MSDALHSRQRTLAKSCQIRGRGYWSGEQVCATVHPAGTNHGITFTRTDLHSSEASQTPATPATVEYRDEAALRTNLKVSNGRVEMIEHLMSALVGLGICNADVRVDRTELPALDGSSIGYANRLQAAGIVEQNAPPVALALKEPFRIGDGDAWVEVHPSSRGETIYEYQLDYGRESDIPPCKFTYELSHRSYVSEVAPARTFVTLSQADLIRSQGLASHVTNEDLLVIGPHGPIENRYRFPNECARHKTLDLIGDLALSGVFLIAHVVSHRGGHALNGAVAQRIRDLAIESGLISQRPYVLSQESKFRRAA
ncbi:MAG: UDP-3-O-acyl-N-acetylglucosamine deacetylase [Planctomycetota bacterium]